MSHNELTINGTAEHEVIPVPHASGELSPPRITPDDPAGLAVRLALSAGHQRILFHEPGARRGESEDVHRMRTAARRLRSELRCYEDLLDGEWGAALAGELKWLGGVLGRVRDPDVLMGRLLAQAGDQAETLDPLFRRLGERTSSGLSELQSALVGERYRSLLTRLGEAVDHPDLRGAADEPCRTALPPLVARAWRRLKTRGRALRPLDPVEDFHEVRKRAKRARYAAESVAPALGSHAGEDAKRFARRATDIQDVLGEHQDAVVAMREIEQAVAQHPLDGPFNLAAGRLIEREDQAARAARERFFDVWDDFDRKKLRRWFRV